MSFIPGKIKTKKRVIGVLHENLPLIILLLASVISSLGIFFHGIDFTPLQIIWFFGYITACSLLLVRLTSGMENNGLLREIVPFIATVLLLNLLIQLTDGVDSYLFPLYLLLIVATSTYSSLPLNIFLISFIILLEGINLIHYADEDYYFKALAFLVLFISIPTVIKSYIRAEKRQKALWKGFFHRIKSGAQAMAQLPDLHEGSDVKNISKDSRREQFEQLTAKFDAIYENLLKIVGLSIKESHSSIIFFHDKKEGTLHIQRGITKSDKGLNYQIKIPIGRGIIGWVSKEKRSFRFLSLDPSREKLEYYNQHTRIRSLIAVPVLHEEQLEGIICVDSLKENAFTEEDEKLLHLFAKELGYQIRNLKEGEITHRRTHEFASILGISKALNSRLDLKHRLDTMADKAKEILEYDHCFIILVDEKERQGAIMVARGYNDPDITDKRFLISDGLISLILKNRVALIFSNIEYEKKQRIFPRDCDIPLKVKSFLGIPMTIEERIIGIFILTSQKESVFSGYDKYILSFICNHGASSISDAYHHAQVEALATTDGLTGISNHRRFQERLNGEFERIARHPEPVSLLMIDIDHFKKINDNFGHPTGDLVLKKIANILLKMTRKIDTVARYGGEEFVLLLLNTDKKQAVNMAERIRKTVETARFEFDGKKIPVTLSLGMATTPMDAKSKKEMIEFADKALYHSKRNGRNQAWHYSDIVEMK